MEQDCGTTSPIYFFPPLCLYVVYIYALIAFVCMTVSLRPLHVSVRENVYWCQCVVFLLSLRMSSPIRLLCSVMGAQGGLRLAPWSVLIWLAFRYGSDTLPLTRRETQTAPPHLPSSTLILFSFSFSLVLPLSFFLSLSDTHTFSSLVCISAFTPLPQDEAKWGQIDMNLKERSGGGGNKEK